jgi:hypothetical protein
MLANRPTASTGNLQSPVSDKQVSHHRERIICCCTGQLSKLMGRAPGRPSSGWGACPPEMLIVRNRRGIDYLWASPTGCWFPLRKGEHVRSHKSYIEERMPRLCCRLASQGKRGAAQSVPGGGTFVVRLDKRLLGCREVQRLGRFDQETVSLRRDRSDWCAAEEQEGAQQGHANGSSVGG